MLIVEEHRINSPINERLQQCQSSINDIVDEIKTINSIFKLTNKSDIDMDTTDIDINQSIRECTSIEQFIQQSLQTGQDTDPSKESTEVKITDNELMTLIKGYVQKIGTQYTVPRPMNMQADLNTVEHIRDQVKSCILLMDAEDVPIEKFTHDLDHQVMCIRSETYSFFSPMTNTWTVHEYEGDEYSGDLYTAAVYARGNAYIFGTNGDDTYSRFSLADRQWHFENKIEGGVKGGYYISTVYDGDKTIYLVGGINKATENRVDTFNIETKQFQHLATLKNAIATSNLILHSNILYCFGGFNLEDTYLIYNLVTKEETIVNLPSRIDTFAYDGQDKVYIMFARGRQFTSMSLSTKRQSDLTPPPIKPDLDFQSEGGVDDGVDEFGPQINILCRCTSEPNTLLFLQGTDYNYRYSIKRDKWTKINDNDAVDQRGWCGLLQLYDGQ
ncbi:hypothetical protein SAMD00019534_049710 [Acytostelium subglobosum LB1]|uniref:hypothetical protein n=1 Tax=Acytostelium subglobosum LB1 TaxID=1410327 RepID=UPI000644CA75|nr:hypothetical protein SAMD00019534_049710 [Acytostelium subglobosum LB1]GAM21796.1 hypothetical protein SAMD00019534_049710 [Acytostelium subglobosum LB1]|eukprot:XP_012754896.1 hypothetical protein SAMD00019534_049710 [Acytostelium subglobosum LB1]